jgi:hypothetical protein
MGTVDSLMFAKIQLAATNAPPSVAGIPDQSVAEGSAFATITLDNYVTDPDNADADLTWVPYDTSNLDVAISASRIATITVEDADWNGTENIRFRVTDPTDLWDEDTAAFTVTGVNDAPVVTDIPNQQVAFQSNFATITLDNYVSDVDNTDAQMTWTYSGNVELTVDITNRIATITKPSSTWAGSETITFRATDPGALYDEDAASFTIQNLHMIKGILR